MSIVTLNDRGVRSVTTFGSVSTGSMVFIKKLTASSSGTLSFVNGSSDVVLDSTYKEYVFTFNNIHSSGDNVNFSFNGSIDSGSNYNATKTTTFFISGHKEDDASTHFDYDTGRDIAQGTGFQKLAYQSGSSNDENLAGTLHLFNPSSTTFVKHFISRTVLNTYHDYLFESYVAGYFNTTSAIDAIQFKMDSGNIDAGDICLYGIL